MIGWIVSWRTISENLHKDINIPYTIADLPCFLNPEVWHFILTYQENSVYLLFLFASL